MAQLAIKGHKTRGKEVIQLLEMLGGKSNGDRNGYNDDLYYFIAKDGLIYGSGIEYEELACNYTILTIKEFLAKFPYKVGDKVTLDKSPCIITGMSWYCDDVIYYVKGAGFSKGVCSTDKDLQPYEEETNMETDCKKCGLHYGSVKCFDMDYCPNHNPKSNAVGLKDGKVIECEVNKEPDMVEDNYCETLETKVFGYKVGDVIFTNNTGWIRITNKLWDCYAKEHTYKGIGWINEQEYDNISHKDITGKIELDKVTDKNNCNINCPDGYEFYDDNGNLIGNKITMRLKKPTYPKTYEECCDVIGISRHDVEIDLPHPYQQKMFNLFKIHICRDAYWKIAGKEMGLDKPWEPDWDSELYLNYTIIYNGMFTTKTEGNGRYALLAFPTKEMRDAFHDNFKELIEQCKEVL